MAIKYKWLAEQLRKKVSENMEKGITRLPSEQELCYRYRVSRQTVRQSLSLLQQEGLIVKKQGSGSYITGLTSENNVIGVLVADDQDAHYAALLGDIRQTLSEMGFSTNVYLTRNRTHTERAILSALKDSPPRGLIVEGVKSALPNPNLDLYRQLNSLGIPMVFLSAYYAAFYQQPYIKEDNVAGSALLTRHLLEQGHREIGGIFKSDDMQGVERYRGFMEAMQECGITVPDERICWYCTEDSESFSAPVSSDFLSHMAQVRLQGCTAVVCHNDEIAYLLSRISQIPAIASCDNTYANAGNLLPFTTLKRRPHELGNAAAQAITDRLKGLAVPSRELSWELAMHGSTREPLTIP